jgi:hypothetical protein
VQQDGEASISGAAAANRLLRYSSVYVSGYLRLDGTSMYG